MGEDDHKLQGIFYSANGSDKEFKKLATTELPKFAPGGEIEEMPIFDNVGNNGRSYEFTVKIRTIKKKRFIKLLMSKGHQRNEAYKMHEEYMRKNKSRTLLQLYIFEAFYNTEPEFKILIGGKEQDVNTKTNNM